MAAPSTAVEFLDVLLRSGLLDEDRLEESLQRIDPEGEVAERPPIDVARLLVEDGGLTRFQADQLLLGKSRGFIVGDYQVLEPLGSGGMASVYLCAHRDDGHRVAIKVLPKKRAEDSEVRKRFQREGHAVASLHHPNIVQFFGMGSDDKQHFLIMEYVDGCNLAEYVKRNGPPEIHRGVDFVCQAAAGLHHVHRMGFVHRDVKPANLLIDRLGKVKVFDMGLVRFHGGDEELLTQAVVGTADFIAPEQSYDSHHVDYRADVYSLGATAYFVLGGVIPFGDGTIMAKIQAHRTKQPVPLRTLRPEVPEELAAIVAKMMAKDPARRYPNLREVIEELQAFRKG